jgi:AcrR family transcriptional regulator
MSDYSLSILAFLTDIHGRQSPYKSQENCVAEAFSSHCQCTSGGDSSHSSQGGFRQGQHEPIAEVAGVSVGSLYQYFPSKEALVAALIDRHNQEVMQAVQGELAEAANLPLEQAVRKLVWVAVKAHRIDPKLHEVLAEQIPRVGKLKKIETFNRQNYVLFASYLENHRDEIRAADLGLAAFVCVTSIEALTHTAVLHHKLASDDAMGALVGETTRLVVGYLKG